MKEQTKKLSDEDYFIRFKKYVSESDIQLDSALDILCEEPDRSDECDFNIECDSMSQCDSKSECDLNLKDSEIKKETLTKKEKRKKESDERSRSKKRNWNVTQDTEKLKTPAGYKELKSLSKGITEKKKPACSRSGEKGHNYYHDKDGRFSTKEKATSWSNDIDFYGGSRTDCIGGKFKSDGKGRKIWTKNKCGAKKGGGKHPHKCKGDKIKEDLISSREELKNFPTNVLIEEILNRLDEGMDTGHILRLCAAINSASDGVWPPKKK